MGGKKHKNLQSIFQVPGILLKKKIIWTAFTLRACLVEVKFNGTELFWYK